MITNDLVARLTILTSLDPTTVPVAELRSLIKLAGLQNSDLDRMVAAHSQHITIQAEVLRTILALVTDNKPGL